MPRHPLTPRPSVPVLVQMAAVGALTLSPLGCGDDEGGGDDNSNETFDSAPTAGPCYHDGGDLPECQATTGGPDLTSGTASSGPDETTFDSAPTAGPCFHNPDSPECATTGGVDSSGTAGSDSSDESSGTDSGSSTTG